MTHDSVDAWDGAAPPAPSQAPDRERVDAINWELRLIEMRQRAKRLQLALISEHVILLQHEREYHAAVNDADTLEAKLREWQRAT